MFHAAHRDKGKDKVLDRKRILSLERPLRLIPPGGRGKGGGKGEGAGGGGVNVQ